MFSYFRGYIDHLILSPSNSILSLKRWPATSGNLPCASQMLGHLGFPLPPLLQTSVSYTITVKVNYLPIWASAVPIFPEQCLCSWHLEIRWDFLSVNSSYLVRVVINRFFLGYLFFSFNLSGVWGGSRDRYLACHLDLDIFNMLLLNVIASFR